MKKDKTANSSFNDLFLSSDQSRAWSNDALSVGIVHRADGTHLEGVCQNETIAIIVEPFSVIGGFDRLKDRDVTFFKNDFTFCPEGTFSSSIATKPGKSIFLTFDTHFRETIEESFSGRIKLDEPLTATSGLRNAAAYAQMVKTFLDSGGIGGRLRLESLVTLLMGDVYNCLTKSTDDTPGHKLPDHVMSQIKEYIDAKSDTKIGVQELARLANFSVFHFSKAFKETTGLPPHQYVVRHRLERVQNLLETTPLSLAQVAYDAGFSSQSHMSVAFRKCFGTSPGKYRKSVEN